LNVIENRVYLNELSELAESLKLSYSKIPDNIKVPDVNEANILFICNLSDSQKNYLLKNSECLLYTPSFEHFGIVPLEAMYLNCPVVAVRNGGPLESIEDGKTGILCESDEREFAKAIAHILKVGKSPFSGRVRVEKSFSLASFAGALNIRIMELKKDGEAWWVFLATWAVLVCLLCLLFL
jgi:alpha-1,3/alpha-1,6-mannosyltransferase